jgi:hypothetical protein
MQFFRAGIFGPPMWPVWEAGPNSKEGPASDMGNSGVGTSDAYYY